MQEELIENNIILKITIEFSLMIINYCDKLDELKKFTLSKQLLKSGTSIGANCMEAQNAESKADFIHKIKISAKEADETQYWLILCEAANNYPPVGDLKYKLTEVQKIINKILNTSKSKSQVS